MKKSYLIPLLASSAFADTGLTIYNQGIAVVRETVPLTLKDGVTQVSFDHATAQVARALIVE